MTSSVKFKSIQARKCHPSYWTTFEECSKCMFCDVEMTTDCSVVCRFCGGRYHSNKPPITEEEVVRCCCFCFSTKPAPAAQVRECVVRSSAHDELMCYNCYYVYDKHCKMITEGSTFTKHHRSKVKAFTIGGSRENRHFWIAEDASDNTLSLLWGTRRNEYTDPIRLATVDDVKIESTDCVCRLKLLQGRSELLTFESPKRDRDLCERWKEALRAGAAVSKVQKKINLKKGGDSLRYSTMTASRHQSSPRGTPRQHRKSQRKEDSDSAKKPLLSHYK